MKKLMIALLALTLLVSAESCKKWNPFGDEPDGKGGNPKDPPQSITCSTTGTITQIYGGGGVWGELWIKTDGGKLFQPCSISIIYPPNVKVKMPNIKPGVRVKFGYTKLYTGSCNDLNRNPASSAIPPAPDASIDITCLTELGSSQNECTYTGTLVSVPCGISVFNNLWILRDDGKYFQPCDIGPSAMLLSTEFIEGKRVSFNYAPLGSGSTLCDNEKLMLCPTILPQRTKIKLTCVTLLDQKSECKPLIKAVYEPKGQQPIQILNAWRDGDCLKMKVGFSGCSDISSSFNLFWDGSMTKSNPPKVFLQLGGLPEGITCAAYFESEISFSLSELKQLNAKIILSGWDIEL